MAFRRVTKPDRPVIQIGHPLTRGLTNLFLLDERGGGVHDLVKSVTGTPSAAIAQSVGMLGRAPSFSGANYYTLSKPMGPTILPVSFVTGFRCTSLASTNGLFESAPQAPTYYGISCRINTNGAVHFTYGNGNGAGSAYRESITTGADVIAAGGTYHLGGVAIGNANLLLYRDGLPLTGAFSGTGNTYNAGSSGGHIGLMESADLFTGMIFYLMIYGRLLLPSEFRQLAVDPYVFLRPPGPVLKAGVAGTTTIQLDWIDNSEHEDGFSIERDDDGGGFVEIDTVAAGIETYNNNDVPEGHSYTYRVKASSAALGDSEYSNEAEVIVA